MRDDQIVRLQALSERLGEVVIEEVDPHKWPGNDKPLGELTQQERGDRYWCKKNAVATISLTIRIGSLIGMIQRRGDPPGEELGDGDGTGLLDAEVAAAEAEAKKLLAKLERRSRAKTPQ